MDLSRQVSRRERTSHRGVRKTYRRYIVVSTTNTVLDVVLEVGTNSQQVVARQRDPIPQRPRYTPKGTGWRYCNSSSNSGNFSR